MRFGVLGPLAVHDDDVPVTPAAPILRRLLAVLLCRPGHPVSAADLAEILWDGAAPRSAHKTLQVHVHRLRRTLGRNRIEHSPAGYRLAVEPGELDAWHFADLAERGRAARQRGELYEASALFRQALALWRGTAYADARVGALINDRAQRLEEQRLQTVEERAQVELDLGRHTELVPELTSLAGTYPYRERLRALLMLAFYRSSRQADALEVFRQTRALLTGELGVEPGALMRRLHEAMLHADDRLATVATDSLEGTWRPIPPVTGTIRVPRELPRDVAAFTGRTTELAALDSLLPARHQAAPVPVAVLTGTAGSGKTALAVHWGHRVADRFPDGQLYVNLRGHAPQPPLRPIDALSQLLHGLGAPAEPRSDEVSTAERIYRTLLADLRVLVVLDDASCADQVRPLLPGGRSSFVLVTSRDLLGGLVARDGAHRLRLDVLTADEAEDLLTRLVGVDRAYAEPAAVTGLAAACGYLPLALRIAATQLAAHPRHRVASYTTRLRGRDRLSLLAVAGDEQASVRLALDPSYTRLPHQARRLFRLLGLAPGHDITVAAAAAVADIAAEEAEELLDALASANLLNEYTPGRYTCHTLLHDYAAWRAAREDTDTDRCAALGRLYEHLLRTGWRPMPSSLTRSASG
jgi:DNA-binding SARP family transcriptional activator